MSEDVCFTSWVSWASRNCVLDKGKSGVYVIGRFQKQPPEGPADPFDEHIVYIGESSGERFAARWRSFERSAFQNKGKHGGGQSYKREFGGCSSVLYVSTLSDVQLVQAFLGSQTCSLLDIDGRSAKVPITDNTLMEIDSLLTKYMERRLILLYALVHGHRPACNAD